LQKSKPKDFSDFLLDISILGCMIRVAGEEPIHDNHSLPKRDAQKSRRAQAQRFFASQRIRFGDMACRGDPP